MIEEEVVDLEGSKKDPNSRAFATREILLRAFLMRLGSGKKGPPASPLKNKFLKNKGK